MGQPSPKRTAPSFFYRARSNIASGAAFVHTDGYITNLSVALSGQVIGAVEYTEISEKRQKSVSYISANLFPWSEAMNFETQERPTKVRSFILGVQTCQVKRPYG